MTETRTAAKEKNDDDDNKNGDGGAKSGNKIRGGIDGSVPKDKEGNDFNNKKCKYMDILLFFQNN